MEENDNDSPLDNYDKYIEEAKLELTNQKDNCYTCYNDIKVFFESIEKNYPEINLNDFSDFFQVIEEFFQIFISFEDTLSKFKYLNTRAQKMVKEIESKEIEISDLKTRNEALEMDIQVKDSCIGKLEDNVRDITKDFISLYDKVNSKSDNDFSEIHEKEKNNLISTITKLKEDNSNLNKELSNLGNKYNFLSKEVTTKYVLKTEHEKCLKLLKKEVKELNEIANQKDKIVSKLQAELSQLYNVRDELMTEIDDKNYEIEQLRTTTRNDNSGIDMGGNLDALLNKSKDDDVESGGVVLTERSSEKSEKDFNIKITSTDVINNMKNDNFKELRAKKEESGIKSAYRYINGPLEKRLLSRNKQDDYYKQFFFLTFQAIKLNTKNIEPFLSLNPEKLYTDCRNLRIPFHKYHQWLENQIFPKNSVQNNHEQDEYDSYLSFISTRLV